jgi:hypothetical protein
MIVPGHDVYMARRFSTSTEFFASGYICHVALFVFNPKPKCQSDILYYFWLQDRLNHIGKDKHGMYVYTSLLIQDSALRTLLTEHKVASGNYIKSESFYWNSSSNNHTTAIQNIQMFLWDLGYVSYPSHKCKIYAKRPHRYCVAETRSCL